MPELFDALEDWYEFGIAGLGLDVPVWITETGSAPFCHNYTRDDPQAFTDGRDYVMEPLRTWFESADNPGYDRVYWFLPWTPSPPEQAAWWCAFLADAEGLTPLGVAWIR